VRTLAFFILKKMLIPSCSDLSRSFESCARFVAPAVALCIFTYCHGLDFARFCLSLRWMLKTPKRAPILPIVHPLSAVADSLDVVPVKILRRSIRGSYRMKRAELIGQICALA